MIEWASRAEGILPEDCLWISLKRLDESKDFRLIELTVAEKHRDFWRGCQRVKILAIDTSSMVASAAVMDGQKLLAEHSKP